MRWIPVILPLTLGAALVVCGGETATVPTDGGGEVADADEDGTADGKACHALLGCVLVRTRCCGCGDTASELDAVASARVAVGADACAGIACAPCPEPPTPFTRDQFVAACRAEACAVEDVRTSDLSACSDDRDCVLDVAGCCACGPTPLVAVHRAQLAAYRALACTAMTGACPPCVPLPPAGWEPYCSPTKHCAGRPAARDAGGAPDAAGG